MLGPYGDADTTFGDADFGWFGFLLGNTKLGGAAGLVGMLTLGTLILVAAWIMQIRVVNTGWSPGSASSHTTAPAGAHSGAASGNPTYDKIAPPVGAPARHP
ncbi:hypothetical protein [Streptomyces sp. NPDC016675]|uniref:hypothetical protein n=1 Tax=Streptomyces sp. NPDC016675 TaxID=3364970 RepID=UPI0036FB94B4